MASNIPYDHTYIYFIWLCVCRYGVFGAMLGCLCTILVRVVFSHSFSCYFLILGVFVYSHGSYNETYRISAIALASVPWWLWAATCLNSWLFCEEISCVILVFLSIWPCFANSSQVIYDFIIRNLVGSQFWSCVLATDEEHSWACLKFTLKWRNLLSSHRK